jgi:hypothetical protein
MQDVIEFDLRLLPQEKLTTTLSKHPRKRVGSCPEISYSKKMVSEHGHCRK